MTCRTPVNRLEHAGEGAAPPSPEPIPLPDQRLRLPMRDGVRLDTSVWLPSAALRGERVPAILMRGCYKESLFGFKVYRTEQLVDAGYAVVIQLVRGIGASESRFIYNAPHDRSDGHDTVEWIAAQPWCTGAVGMNGSSYLGMTQVAAALARPPHLRCIVPVVPSIDYFRETPYAGGMFLRQHTMNWARLIQVDTLAELHGGFMGTKPVMAKRDMFERLLSRPLINAAAGYLTGDFERYYREALAHPVFDDWWRERTFDAQQLGAVDIPALVVSGNFDFGIGAVTLWRGLDSTGGHPDSRLLIGPWDHGQCYGGGAAGYGPYTMGEDSVLDLAALRLAFFDKHLRGSGDGLPWRERVRVFVTGTNRWHAFDHFPPREAQVAGYRLTSGGRANTAWGDGCLVPASSPMDAAGRDTFEDDPELPFIGGVAAAREPDSAFDLRERERQHATLVYDSGPLAQPLTLLGESVLKLWTSADVPDADIVAWLAEHRGDGQTIRLAISHRRLSYSDDCRERCELQPGVPVAVRMVLPYVAHTLPAGSSLRLLVCGSHFPFTDPNPHNGLDFANAVNCRVATQTVHHGAGHPSTLELSVLP
jgi:uncharacterized protein